jgi:hypothetical protein
VTGFFVRAIVAAFGTVVTLLLANGAAGWNWNPWTVLAVWVLVAFVGTFLLGCLADIIVDLFG